MWRPNNWKNPHTPMQEGNFANLADAHFRQIADGKHYAYEDGANAMLEALKADKVEIGTVFSSSGWLVFIPDKE